MKLLIFVLLTLFAALQYKLWFGDGSITAWRAMKVRTELQAQENERLESRNAAMAATINDLKTGTHALEDQARQSLGMVKDDEVYYQFIDPQTHKALK